MFLDDINIRVRISFLAVYEPFQASPYMLDEVCTFAVAPCRPKHATLTSYITEEITSFITGTLRSIKCIAICRRNKKKSGASLISRSLVGPLVETIPLLFICFDPRNSPLATAMRDETHLRYYHHSK